MSLAAGCGGRTSALEGDYGYTEGGSNSFSGSGNEGGTVSPLGGTASVAGRPGHAGSSHGGTRAVGGNGAGGTSIYPVGGYGGSQVYPTGGSYIGGSGPIGGYGGYSGSYSGAGGYSGYPFGGYAGFGGYPVGGFGGAPQDCQSCLTQACAPEVAQCFQDFGCLSIFGCIASRGCQPFQCYTDAQCKGVIDQWGGPAGASMTELLQTFSCAFQAGCQCGG